MVNDGLEVNDGLHVPLHKVVQRVKSICDKMQIYSINICRTTIHPYIQYNRVEASQHLLAP